MKKRKRKKSDKRGQNLPYFMEDTVTDPMGYDVVFANFSFVIFFFF